MNLRKNDVLNLAAHDLKSAASPLQSNERIEIADVLRGFALGGVLFVNMLCFIFKVLPQNTIAVVTSWKIDIVFHTIMTVFFYEKFITLFCILFGFGFGVMIQNLERKKIGYRTIFLRRMAFLLLLGLLNFSFMLGDILHQYAFCGLILFLFRKASNQSILFLAIIFLVVLSGFIRVSDSYLFPNVFSDWDNFTREFTNTVKSGNMLRVAEMHWKGIQYVYYQNLFELRYACEITGKFLLGFYILKKGYLQNLPVRRALLNKLLAISCPLFLIHIALVYLLKIEPARHHDTVTQALVKICYDLTTIASTLFYVGCVCWLYMKLRSSWLITAFKYIGRMTLTNYLTQSVIYSFLFYGFGLGLLGKIHLTILVAVGVIIYGLQALLSYYWLQHFKFGPIEWVWRQVTYMKRISIR